MKKLYILLLCFIIASNLKAQCTAPSFTVDLRAAVDTTAIINDQTRSGVCCGSSNCITFLVYSNSNSDLISFDVTSPSPSGSAYYQVNCGTPVSIGTPLCIKGLASPFTITYCKPGGDAPDYVISAGKAVHGSEDISIHKTGCRDTLFVTNVNISSIVWTSIYPGVQGAYNSYLSCTAGCNSSIVTPGANPPPYIDFKVSGSPIVTCGSFTSDTVRVYFVDNLTGTVTPANPVICSTSGTSLTLTANITGGATPYKYDWSNVAGTNNSYTTAVSAAGTYSVIVTDNTRCPALTLTKIIGTIPVTTFSYSPSSSGFCKMDPNPAPIFSPSGQAGVFSATPPGLSFVNTNTGVIDLAASNPGTYVVTNTVSASGSCSGSSATTTVIIHPFPSMTSASTATICSGNVVNISLTSSSNADFNWIAADNVNTTGESITVQTSPSLINTLINTGTNDEPVVYTITPISNLAGGCVGLSQLVNVTVRPEDDASFTYPSSTNCQTGINPVATITGLAGGTFTAGSGLVFQNSVGTIDLSASAIGSYTVTYSTNGVCPNTQEFPINITTAPMAGFGFSGSPYCQNESNPLPTFSPGASGGAFSSSAGLVFANNLTGEIDLASSTPGTYTVTNTIAPSGLCGTSTATAVVTITQLQEAGFSYISSPICQNSTDPLPTFVPGGVAGTFASTTGLNINSSTGLINLSGSTPGTYTVSNTIAAIGGCAIVNYTSNITITELPIATFNYSATPYCSNSSSQFPTFTGGGVAGTFNASSVYLNIDPATGGLNISNSTAGDYIVVNTIAAANGCPAVVASTSVTITKLPDATIAYSGPYCSNSSNPTPTLGIDGTNGNYTSNPAGLNLDLNAGTIDLASSTAGTYTITNTVPASNGCPAVTASFNVTVTKLPSAAFGYSAPSYCIDESDPSPVYIGDGVAGVFSANPTLSINASNGLVNLSGCNAGTYTVTNLIAATNGCPNVNVNTTITINPMATANAGADAAICADQSYTLSGGIGGAASGLLWSTTGSGTFSDPTSATSLYTPSASDILTGSVILTITTDDPSGPCSFATDVMTLTIKPTPTVSAGPGDTLTCSHTTLSLTGSGHGDYLWEGPGIVSGANTPNPVINQPGTYSLVIVSSLGCFSETSIVTILQDTIAPIVASANTGSLSCATLSVDASATTTTSPVSYNWSGAGIISSANISTITINQGGNYNYTVTNTVNNCITTGSLSIIQDTIIPSVLISNPSLTTTCTNPITTLSIACSPSTDVSYTWTAPTTGSLDSYTSSNPTASGSGIFTVAVTNTISGCVTSLTQHTVEVLWNNTIPSATLSTSNISITCAVPTPTAGVTTNINSASYSWTPASGIVSGTETSATPSFSLPGTYSVVVTNTNSGCASSANTNIVTVDLDNTIPVVNITGTVNNGTITCSNTSISVSPTVTPSANLTYSWTSGSGSGISGPSNQSTATFTSSGTYTLVVTNTVTGCMSSPDKAAIFTVYENTVAPTVLIFVPSVTTTCANPTATLNIISVPFTNVVYSWTAPSTGSLNSYNVSNPVASGSGIFTVVVTDTVSGCTSSSITQSTINVTPDNGIPTTTLSADSVSITCANPNPSVTLSSNTSNASYSWLPVAGIVSGTENTASPSFSLAGTYSAVVTNTSNGCSTFINSNVVTATLNNTIPVVSLTGSVNNGTITCSTSTVVATASVTPGNDLSYTWTSASGTGISGPSNQSSATFTASGNYTLAVTNTVTGCASALDASSIFTVFVDTISPIANFKFVTGCSKDSVKFIDQSSISSGNITDWNWTFGDGNNSLLQNPANTYSQVNTYTVSLLVRAANGCLNVSNSVVSLIPPVLADFTPGGGDFLIHQPIAFSNQSSGSTNYLWNFGDGATTSSTDPTHAFTSLGSYGVMLVASNSIGCKDSISFVVNIKPAGYAIPGGFTPNGDGVNDGFSVLGGPFSSYELRVFNAWGNEIYVANSQTEKWDGSYKDTQQPAGTYIYIFNGKIVDGEDLKLKGEVHIIR